MVQSNSQSQYMGISPPIVIFFKSALIWPNPITNPNTWVYHPLGPIMNFSCALWYDPIQLPIPIHGYIDPYSDFLQVRSDMTQSNSQSQYMGTPPLKWFSSCALWYGPIQFPIPIHGYITPFSDFLQVRSDMTQSNSQSQYMGISTPIVIFFKSALIWPNPIPNPNTWVYRPL